MSSSVTVKMNYFDYIVVATKSGEKTRLKQISMDVNAEFILNFLEALIPKIIFHRNDLKHYRSVNNEFDLMFHNVKL